MKSSPWPLAFPHQPPLSLDARLCSVGSSVLCQGPTPPQRSCSACGAWPSRAVLSFIEVRHCGGLPVLVHVVSQRAWGLRLRGVATETREKRLCRCCLPHVCTGSAPRNSSFRSSMPCPLMPLFTLRRSPHDAHRKTRGQDGSLLLSCRTLSFPTTCRFDPGARTQFAHRIDVRVSQLPDCRPSSQGCLVRSTWLRTL